MVRVSRGYCSEVLLLAVVAAAAGVAAAAVAAEQPAAVVVDVAPGVCPNHLRIDSPLTLAVGIIGTADLDVTTVEPATVRLSREDGSGTIAPLEYVYKDVGSPLIGGRCECQEPQGDGLGDLVFYFDIKSLVAAFGLAGRVGDTVPLAIAGQLVTGDAISGVDCAQVIDSDWTDHQVGRELGFLDETGGQQAGESIAFAYFTDVSDHLTLEIYDPQGRAVATLVNMDLGPGIYRATWDRAGADGRRVAAGTYFARVSNSRTGYTRRIQVQDR